MTVAVLLAPFAALLLGGMAALLRTGDALYATSVVFLPLAYLAFPAIIAPVALLGWLAAEGLRLSRDAGATLLRSAPRPGRLLAGLLLAKAALLVALLLLGRAGPAPVAVHEMDASVWPYAAAVPPVFATLLLLTANSVWACARTRSTPAPARSGCSCSACCRRSPCSVRTLWPCSCGTGRPCSSGWACSWSRL